MREILFRGKRTDNGEWVEGFLLKECNYATCSWNLAIEHKTDRFGKFAYDVAEINPETVGQFTGLTDKNGKKIFEGDILDCKSGLYERCKVIYNEFCSAFQLECVDGFSDFFLCSINHKEMEIIGNIHDNPELLENP